LYWSKVTGVEAIFAFRNASSESVASVRQLVEKFVAQRNLRQERMTDGFDARGHPATRAEFVQVWKAQESAVLCSGFEHHCMLVGSNSCFKNQDVISLLVALHFLRQWDHAEHR
jgi:hypothetical protein